MSKAAELANLIGNINAGSSLANKNLVQNGAMNVYQRGKDTIDHDGTTSAYVLDRFKLDTSGMDELHLTVTQDSSVPSGQGFANSMKVDITTAESALASDEYIRILHPIEAQNLQLLNYGTSDAKKITLSFWVKSNLTGAFAVSIYQPDDDRIINSTYSISSANTWEKKTITFDGDTTGVIDDNNGAGFYINFCLGTGSDRTGTASSSWSAFANAKMFNGQVANITSSASNNFYITGVQLEIGQNPTSFEFEPFDVTLAKCQRYYFHTYGYGHDPFTYGWSFNQSYNGMIHLIGTGNYGMATFYQFPVEMRASPVVYLKGHAGTNARITYWNGSETTYSSANVNSRQLTGFNLGATSATEDYYSCGGVFDAEL